jgi:hypothetical protein
MTEHPTDLASFRAALLEGDRRLVRRRRRNRATGGLAVVALVAVLLTTLPFGGGTLNATALAASARQALERPGLVLHSETEIVGPDGRVDQTISRWSLGARSRTISDDGEHRVEQASDGRTVRVRLEPGGRIDTLPGNATLPDPLLEYRRALDRATEAEEVEVDGVPAYRLVMPRQTAYLRRSDRLPIRVELEGGTVQRFRTVEWLAPAGVQLDLK